MRLSLPRLKMPRLPGFSILVWISTALKGWVMGSREKDSSRTLNNEAMSLPVWRRS